VTGYYSESANQLGIDIVKLFAALYRMFAHRIGHSCYKWALRILLSLFTVFNFHVCAQGNALKDAGRVEEAITCYQVGSSTHLLEDL
jgi:hypothetical protein